MNTIRTLLTVAALALFTMPVIAESEPAPEAKPAPVVEIAPAEQADEAKPEFDPNATGPDKVEVQPLAPDLAQPGDFEAVPVEPAPVEMKRVAFLGVATQPFAGNATKELNIPQGLGLSVMHVVPDTPAAKAGLQAGDVLHKLDDQLLMHPLQLRTLIRTKKAGDAITLTVIRAGKPVELKSKLVDREVPVNENAGAWEVAPNQVQRLVPGQRLHVGPNGIVEIGPLLELDPEAGPGELPNEIRERIEAQQREMIKRIKQQLEQRQRQLQPGQLQGLPGIAANASATTVMSDAEHTIKYTITNGKKHLTVTDKKTNTKVFDGPVNTEAELEEVPEPIRKKFEKLDKRMNLNIQIIPDPFDPNEAPAPAEDEEVVG